MRKCANARQVKAHKLVNGILMSPLYKPESNIHCAKQKGKKGIALLVPNISPKYVLVMFSYDFIHFKRLIAVQVVKLFSSV